MKYEIGDKVRIREWDDMAQEFGVDSIGDIRPPKGATIVSSRQEFCGSETTIAKKTDQGNYQLETDHGKWLWPECTLLPAEEVPETDANPSNKKYKIAKPLENSAIFVEAVERYVNTEEFPRMEVILAILGIEKVGVEDDSRI